MKVHTRSFTDWASGTQGFGRRLTERRTGRSRKSSSSSSFLPTFDSAATVLSKVHAYTILWVSSTLADRVTGILRAALRRSVPTVSSEDLVVNFGLEDIVASTVTSYASPGAIRPRSAPVARVSQGSGSNSVSALKYTFIRAKLPAGRRPARLPSGASGLNHNFNYPED